MHWIWWFVLPIAIVLAAFLCSHAKIHFASTTQTPVELEISVWFMKKKIVKKRKYTNGFPFSFTTAKQMVQLVLKHAKIKTVDIDIRIGQSDSAASTAPLSGAGKIVLVTLCNAVLQNHPTQSKVQVLPVYGQDAFMWKIHCIFAMPIGQIIFIGLKLLLIKAGEKHEKSSHRRHYEHNVGKYSRHD